MLLLCEISSSSSSSSTLLTIRLFGIQISFAIEGFTSGEKKGGF
jgi:hypothetical protein